MKRTVAERRGELRAAAVPAGVDLSLASVERARWALRLLRAALAAQKSSERDAPDFGRRPPPVERWAV